MTSISSFGAAVARADKRTVRILHRVALCHCPCSASAHVHSHKLIQCRAEIHLSVDSLAVTILSLKSYHLVTVLGNVKDQHAFTIHLLAGIQSPRLLAKGINADHSLSRCLYRSADGCSRHPCLVLVHLAANHFHEVGNILIVSI